MSVLEVINAIDALHVVEDNGANCDKAGYIAQILKVVGVTEPASWCAATVSYIFHRAAGFSPTFASSSSQAIMRWFKYNDRLSHNPQDILGWSGCIAGWTDNDPNHGHVFIITGRFTSPTGKLMQVGTFEGNTTNPKPGGLYGAFRHHRNVPESNGHQLWFCNTTGLPAGDYL